MKDDITTWLDTATKGLAAEEASSVRAELEAHHADAVATHEAEGKDRLEAQRAALADLGDPQAANRELRRTHLTSGEAARLEGLVRRGGIYPVWVDTALGLLMIAVALAYPVAKALPWALSLVAVGWLKTGAVWWLLRRQPRTAAARRALVLECGAGVIAGALGAGYLSSLPWRGGTVFLALAWVLAITIASLGWLWLRYYPLWRKLGSRAQA